MKHKTTLISLFVILLFSNSISFCNLVLTQDCFTQIVSLSINKPALEIGERLQVNIVYDLYYDPLDPFGIGSVSITIGIQGEIEFITQHAFSDRGFNIDKEITLDISSSQWAPNETGQIGIIKVEAWVQDSSGAMTDSVEQPFTVLRSPLNMDLTPFPSSIFYHEIINLSGSLHNPNNASIPIPNHRIDIVIFQETQIIQSYLQNTTLQSSFTQSIDTELIGTGRFNCNITAQANDDYVQEKTSFSFFVSKLNLTLSITSNASVIQTYYPLMNNCSVLVSATLNCQLVGHSVDDANVTCSLGNSTKPMSYLDQNQFFAVLTAPYYPGNYSIIVRASIPNHNPINNSIPIQVVQRKALIQLRSNCSLAAYGDTIQLTIHAIDETTQIPLTNKICSVFFLNQSIWNLLAQLMLDQNGIAELYWQAQNVGDQDFIFKTTLNGDPEYATEEIKHAVINTHEFRFFLNTSVTVVRQSITNYSIQITTLDFQPISNINISLIEISTNISWCIITTNASGHAILSWYIDSQYGLGIHEFLLIAQDETVPIGSIPITMVIFEQTILELV